MRRERAACVLLAAFAVACASPDDYRAYKESHPGWEATFPRDYYSMAELLAVIHRPPTGRNTTSVVTHLKVLGLGTDPWETIPLEDIREGRFQPDARRLYIAVAKVYCLFTSRHYSREGMRRLENASFIWYVLRDEELLAYDHTEFLQGCETYDRVHGTLRSLPGFEEKLRELVAEAYAE